MRKSFLVLGLLLVASPILGQEDPTFVGGDIVYWIPLYGDSQVLRNEEYFSVSLHGVYLYYKSGFFENIKTVVVQSDVKLEAQEAPAIGSMVNAVREKHRGGEFIGLNDHLALLVPATSSQVRYQVSIKGIGEDRFKAIFDVLSGSDLKVPLNLGQATLGKINGISNIVRKFMANPYTVKSPKGILQIGHSLVVYSSQNQNPDALREGYYVVISAREKKSADLSFLVSQDSPDLKVSQWALYFKNQKGNWVPFERNSYVILAVTSALRRGEDERTDWFRKYSEAQRVADELVSGEPPEEVRDKAVELWQEGNTLLQADANYLEDERRAIRSKQWQEIEESLQIAAEVQLHPSDATELKALLDDPRVPVDSDREAAEYSRMLAEHPPDSGKLSVLVVDEEGLPLPGATVEIEGATGVSSAMSTDSSGKVLAPGVLAGDYRIQVRLEGFSTIIQTTHVEPYTITSAEIQVPVVE